MKTDVSAVTLTGSSNAEKVFNYFSTHGYTPQAAAAVTANLIWESGGGTSLNIYLHTEEVTSNPNKGIGMVQWTGDRRTAFEKYCISKGTTWTNSTLELQMDYLLYELNSGSQWFYPSSVYGATYSKYNKSFAQFKSLTDIDVATGAFCFCFERPNASQSGITSRIANAKRVLETFFSKIDTEKPSNVTLALEKTTFLSTDHVTYYCSGNNVNYYVISIYDSTGKVLETIKVYPGEYATRYYNPGKYIVYCEGFNSKGNTFSNTINFTVKQAEKPSNVMLALEKNVFLSKDHVTYYCTGNNVSYFIISIYDAQGNVVETAKINPGEYCTRYYDIGDYTAYCEGYNTCGSTFSNTIRFKVKSSTEIDKPHQHVYTFSIKKTATCTEPGIRLYTCKDNDDSYEEEIQATGHQHTELRNATAATCSQEGYTGDIYCQDCGELLEEGQVILKIDHVWNKGEVTTTSTCITEGIKTYTCNSCGTTKTEVIAATGHGTTEIRNKKAATTTSEGYTGDTYCTVCNQKISSGNTLAKLTPQTATPGKTLKDKSTNGVYKVLKDGVSVEFMKPVYKKALVRIPDTIKVNGITCKVTGISANAFKNNKSLKSVTIGRNVTVIGTNAFYGCKKLSKVSGGNGIVKIGYRAYANCISLSKMTIPGTVRSIGKQAFCNCKKLRSITIKTSTLSGETVGSKAFAGTYKKPTVKVPAKQLKAYKKLLKARGMSSKAVYRK